ncbi:MAG: glycosyltransferase [Candidatus Peribacteraceae bacterium]|nr:glycosyltransferase [Candidatus Peribacteraceae bacterium]
MKQISIAAPPSFALPEILKTLQEAELTRRPGRHRHKARGGKNVQDGYVHVSIIIPTYNERENLPALLRRLERSMNKERYDYECLIIDDRSTDGTLSRLRELRTSVPYRVIPKQGPRGKSTSILEGLRHARGSIVAMIDADLQYPPEAIPNMVRKIGRYDIVVARRSERRTSLRRSAFSRTFNLVFGRILLSLDVDVQSGLKVFRRKTFALAEFSPSPWGFDYQFLFRAKRMGWTLGSEPIIFEERFHGTSNVRMLSVGMELAWGAVTLRWKQLWKDIFAFVSYPHKSELLFDGFGNDTDYLYLPEIHSAKKQVYWESVSLLLAVVATLAGAVIGLSLLLGVPATVILSGAVACLYLWLITFKIAVLYKSTRHRPITVSPEAIRALRTEDLPHYTVLVPLYREAAVVPQILQAMTAIDYPPDKLEVLITLEAYDHETRAAIEKTRFPAHVRVITLPDVRPKTKPKALNVAFREAKGEFLVIYDAEIVPDADQLKKAVVAFRSRPDIACLQTRLDHYNAGQNWLTKLFNAEFSFYYDLFLPGLQSMGYPLPLSGHSTHFRTGILRQIGAWDPYNVTEDCDVGIRLYRCGYRSDLLDSLSKEEATGTIGAWTIQRSRWVKGFIQTSIIHLRHPLRLKNELGGWKNVVAFLTIIPGSVLINILNLGYWLLLIGWVATGAETIQSLFPGIILYTSLLSFVVGNFLFTYCNLLGSYRRGRYDFVKYSLLSFAYWILLSYATIRGALQMVLHPHLWEKTDHGTHLSAPDYAPAFTRHQTV